MQFTSLLRRESLLGSNGFKLGIYPILSYPILQEPPASLPVTSGWRTLLPPPVRDQEGKTHQNRAIMLISDKIKASSVEQIHVELPDMVGIDLRTESSQLLRIFGIYNPAANLAEHLLTHDESVRRLDNLLARMPTEANLVVAGDFNLQHQEWEPKLAQEPTAEAQEALCIFRDAAAGLVHLLPAGTATYRSLAGSLHCNNLILAKLQTEGKMVSCQVKESLDAQSDHRPSRLVVNLATAPATEGIRRSFRRACPEKLKAAYTRFSAELPAPKSLLTAADLDLEAERLAEILMATLTAAVPIYKPRHTRIAYA